jgi:NitT/TauT family transport system substrate-binding protein
MPIRLAENFRALFYAPLYAAQSLGFYAQEGVEVELIGSAAPGDGVSALLNDTIDITWGGPMRVMKAHDLQRSSPLVCFCEVVARTVLSGGRARSYRLSAPGAGVPSDSQRCRRYPHRGCAFRTICVSRAWIRPGCCGSPISPMAANLEALFKGRLDVVQLFEPYASMALQSGRGKILYAASSRGPTVYTTFVATPHCAQAPPRCICGHDARYCAHAGLAVRTRERKNWRKSAAPFFPQIERNILVSSLRRYAEAGIWARTPDVSRQGFARLGECCSQADLSLACLFMKTASIRA